MIALDHYSTPLAGRNGEQVPSIASPAAVSYYEVLSFGHLFQ
jgi:hypothetical protein